MLILISPAKKLDFDTGPVFKAHTQPRFLADSQQLIDRLKLLSVQEVASLMKLSDELAALNVARFATWQQPFSLQNAKQAILAFKGDVYTGLSAQTLDEADLEYAQRHLRILSGLYGVLKPLDLIQAYRLEMGTRFVNPKGKDLYHFWGDTLRVSIEKELDDNLLINLASAEYFKAVQAKKIQARVITPIFKDWKNGNYKIISFYAKKARGLMSRYIIEQRLDDPQHIKHFDSDGYRFNDEMSSDDDWVFVRD